MSQTLNHLHGRTLESARLDGDTGQWSFVFSGQVVLQASAPWRVVHAGAIVLGWQDDGQQFGLPTPVDGQERLRALVGASEVASTSVTERGDLTIRFGAGPAVELFNLSCGYEGWQLNGPGDRCVVAQGGGRVVDTET